MIERQSRHLVTINVFIHERLQFLKYQVFTSKDFKNSHAFIPLRIPDIVIDLVLFMVRLHLWQIIDFIQHW